MASAVHLIVHVLLFAAHASSLIVNAPSHMHRGVRTLRAAPTMGPLSALKKRFSRNRAEEEVVQPPPVAMEMKEEVVLPPPVAIEMTEAEDCDIDAPEECEEPKMVMSASDKVLVKLGMKTEDECELEPEGENLMEQIKCAGRAGIISYILWEWAFWIGAGGVATFTYYTATGGWPDLSNPEDQGKVAASAFALVNVARFAVPLRIGLALSTVPWVDETIVKPFLEKNDTEE